MTTKYPKTTFKSYNQSAAYLEQQKRIHETGYRWTFYYTGDGWRVLPALRMKEIAHSEENANLIKNAITDQPRSFIDIARSTNLTIIAVLQGAAWLVRNGFCFADVGRSGDVIGIHYTGAVWREIKYAHRTHSEFKLEGSK